jgi:hypothetical protein
MSNIPMPPKVGNFVLFSIILKSGDRIRLGCEMPTLETLMQHVERGSPKNMRIRGNLIVISEIAAIIKE